MHHTTARADAWCEPNEVASGEPALTYRALDLDMLAVELSAVAPRLGASFRSFLSQPSNGEAFLSIQSETQRLSPLQKAALNRILRPNGLPDLREPETIALTLAGWACTASAWNAHPTPLFFDKHADRPYLPYIPQEALEVNALLEQAYSQWLDSGPKTAERLVMFGYNMGAPEPHATGVIRYRDHTIAVDETYDEDFIQGRSIQVLSWRVSDVIAMLNDPKMDMVTPKSLTLLDSADKTRKHHITYRYSRANAREFLIGLGMLHPDYADPDIPVPKSALSFLADGDDPRTQLLNRQFDNGMVHPSYWKADQTKSFGTGDPFTAASCWNTFYMGATQKAQIFIRRNEEIAAGSAWRNADGGLNPHYQFAYDAAVHIPITEHRARYDFIRAKLWEKELEQVPPYNGWCRVGELGNCVGIAAGSDIADVVEALGLPINTRLKNRVFIPKALTHLDPEHRADYAYFHTGREYITLTGRRAVSGTPLVLVDLRMAQSQAEEIETPEGPRFVEHNLAHAIFDAVAAFRAQQPDAAPPRRFYMTARAMEAPAL